MFTVKATYRNQTRKFTFADHQSFFPTYNQIFHQLYRVFPISQSYYLSKLLFSPSPTSPNARILLSKEVHNAEDYERAIRQFQGRSWPDALLRFTVFDETPHKPAIRGSGNSAQNGSAPESRVSSDIWLTGPEESFTVTPSIRVSPTPSPRSPMEVDVPADSLYRPQKYRREDERSMITPGSTTATYVPSPAQSVSRLGAAVPQQAQQHPAGLHDARVRGSSSSSASTVRASPPMPPPPPPLPADTIPAVQDLFASFMHDFERLMSTSFGEDWRARQDLSVPGIPRLPHTPQQVMNLCARYPAVPSLSFSDSIQPSGIPPPPIILSPAHGDYQGSAPYFPTGQAPCGLAPPSIPDTGNQGVSVPHFVGGSSLLWNIPPPPPLPIVVQRERSPSPETPRIGSPMPSFIRLSSPPPPSTTLQGKNAGASANESEETVIHSNVICDACDQTVVGVRHKCLDCPDYDLCTPCMDTGSAERHNPFHEFYDIREPGRVVVHNVFSGLGERNNAPTSRTSPTVIGVPAASAERVRHGARCDLCDSVVTGDRYKCLACPDFDTCQRCFSITRDQHPGHGFVKVKEPSDIIARHDAAASVVHGARCDACNQIIVGARYKCMHPSCPDYDLCPRCEALPIAVHPVHHPMLKLKERDAVIPTVTRVGGTTMVEDAERVRLEDMQAALAMKESELEERFLVLEDREAELHMLQERQREVEEMNALLEGREKIADEKDEELVRREEYIEHQQIELVQRAESLEDRMGDVQMRSEMLEDQLRDLEARRKELDDEEMGLQDKQTELNSMERFLVDWETRLEGKEGFLEYQVADLNERERTLDERERKLEDLQGESREPWIGSPVGVSPAPESPWRRYAEDLIPLNLPAVPTHVPNIQVEPPSPSMVEASRVAVPVHGSPSPMPTPEEIDAIIRRSESTYPEIGVVDAHQDHQSSGESEDARMPGMFSMSTHRSEASSDGPLTVSVDYSLPRYPSDVGSNDLFNELWPAVASELRHLLQPSTDAVPDRTSMPGGGDFTGSIVAPRESEGERTMPGLGATGGFISNDDFARRSTRETPLRGLNSAIGGFVSTDAPAQLSAESVPDQMCMPGGHFYGFERPSAPSRSRPTSTVEVAQGNENAEAYSPPLATEPLLSCPAEQLAPAEVLSRLANSLANLLSGRPESASAEAQEAHKEQELADPFTDEAAPETRAETPVNVPLSMMGMTHNNIPDGQVFPPGAEFVKSWNVINDGEGDWPETTELVFVAGDRLVAGVDIPKFKIGRVGAGEVVDIWTGELKAPEHPGKYVSYWRLSDGQGNQFGKSLWIDITVAEVDTSSGDESLAASSVIMPNNAGTPALTEAPMLPLVAPSAPSAVTLSDNDSVGSSASLISHPSSPVSVDGSGSEWEDTRDFLTPPLAPHVAGEMEYVVLYESSDSDLGRD
ncbi:hypothetical protein OE88DRAFT_1730284 [Heliocybe sulcata]|uniref:ZZ-type domain-containing protein n=1 Tax=Heliocybe sulcata TaxID=5364 RepID=A0A5C3NSY3_9AGAM|nr:hypothetical protein OE88DRAFT_1730284 [Heliocybe sulcata]